MTFMSTIPILTFLTLLPTGGRLFGPHHLTVSHNSRILSPMVPKTYDFLFKPLEHIVAKSQKNSSARGFLQSFIEQGVMKKLGK